MAALVSESRHIPVWLTQLGITGHFAQVDAGSPVYVMVRLMCAELGVNVDGQLAKLTAQDEETPGYLVEFRIATPGGPQVTKCLRAADAALWIIGINPRKVRPELRSRLEEVRRDVLAAADRIVWGDYTGVLTVSSKPAPGGHLPMGPCPLCHAQLQAYFTPDRGYGLEPVPDSE